MLISGWEPLKECPKLARFGGHRHCGSGDKRVLRVFVQDHLAKGLSNLWVRVSQVNYHPARFGTHKNCGIGDVLKELSP